MLKNYFRTALKNLKNSKLYSFVNITGLSIGIAACTLIFLYVQYELSYDWYNKNAGRIFRLTEILHLPKEDNARALSSPPMAPLLQSTLPEISNTVRISYSFRQITYKERKVQENSIVYADSTLFDIFTFPMIQGNPQKALANPYSVVLTETIAKKFFGSEPALGKTMQLSDTINLIVTGIIKDIPENSHIGFNCIISRSTIFEIYKESEAESWFDNNYYSYLLLPRGYDYKTLEPKIDAVIEKAMVNARKETGLSYNFKLQPITDIHLKSNLRGEIRPNSDIRYVYIFSAAAILILLIACINFINLSTARSVKRSKEIGLRKVAGARRGQLITQFLSESSLYAIVAGAIAIGIIIIALPYFNQFTGKDLSANYLLNPTLVFSYLAIILIVGFLAGLYPAILMSSFQPVKAIKENIKHGLQDILLRKGLVIFQFTISIILISGTALIFKQLQYLQNKKIGLNKEQVLEIPIQSQDLSKSKTIQDELRKISAVEAVSLTSFSFRDGLPSVATLPEGSAENEISSHLTISADENFLNTFQIPVIAGRNFSSDFQTDSKESFIINETAVKYFGWGGPHKAIGKSIDWGLGKKGRVIGVAKDFNFSSLHENIKPLIIHMMPGDYGFVAMRVKPGNITQTLKQIESTWKNTAINSTFSYSFVNEDFENLYKAEHNMQSVLSLFTLLSVFISCLGIFGLAAFTIGQRFKEIGVRKALGASVTNITASLSKDFIKLVAFAVIIASPIAYFGIYKWLESFAYRINISWWIILIAGISAMLIALITISFQSIKAAMANPVNSLRAE